MSEGVVPDSDPLPPPLDPSRPEWILLGPASYEPVYDDESVQDADSVSNSEPLARDKSEARTGSETLGHGELMLDSSPLLPPVKNTTPPEPLALDTTTMAVDEPALSPNREARVAFDEDTTMTDSHIPRRKRFNFETWVRYEKRAHEKVYHRRYAVFHGANSDSEDDDYGEMDDASGDLETPHVDIRQLEPEDLEVMRAESPGQEDSSRALSGNGAEASTAFQAPRRRRLHIIDSESESEHDSIASDAESESSGNSVLPIYEQRLTKPIPASRQLYSVSNADSQPESFPKSLPDSESPLDFQQPHRPQQDAHASNAQNARLDQTVREVAPIDYMLSRRPSGKKGNKRPRRLGHNYTPLAVTDLAHEAGSKATKALRVAARTAQRTLNSREGRPRPDNPLRKVFAGTESREATKTLRHWRQGTLKLDRRQQPPKSIPGTGKQRDGFDPEGRKPTRSVTPPANQHRVLPASRSALSQARTNDRRPLRKKQKSSTSRRRAPEPSPNLFHTTILERQLVHSPAPPLRMSNESSHAFDIPHVSGYDRIPPATYDYSKANRLQVCENSPSQYFDLHYFGKDTFIGSNTLDLLEGPALWNGELIADRSFGTSLMNADESAVTRDAEYVLGTCEGNQGHIDGSLLNKLYDYFLEGTAFLCDESQIVESKFRQHVYRQWLRLARSILKLSLKKRYMLTEIPLVSQLVSLATLLVARRLSTLAEVSFEKASLLVVWTVFYQQSVISGQIDSQRALSPRYIVGAELLYTGIRFKCFDHLPQVFAKHSQASAKWHMLVLLTSFNHKGWSDWQLARSLISLDPPIRNSTSLKPEDVRVATDYIMRLLSKWNWPPSAEMIIDLFNFYAKQQHYADPRGESIWLPDFLLKSRFDGSRRPDQDFSMFLELLGCTLSRFADNQPVCRRIAGRVTPLSAVSFPETREVSLADLSSASHQYGILIVLLRMLPPASRPPISQFRDLVVLKDAHLAIRIKAVSTWSIVSRLATDSSSSSECQTWLKDDILRAEVPPPQLLLVTLRSAADVSPVAPGAVPFSYLLEMGLHSSDREIRFAAWTLLTRVRPSDRHVLIMSLQSLGPHFDNLDESDVMAFAKLIRASPELVEAWPNIETRVVVVTTLLKNHALASNHPIAKRYILLSVLRATWRAEDRQLLGAASIEARSEVGDRQVALRQLLGHSVSKEVASLALSIVKREWDAAKIEIAARVAYKVVVAQTRQLIFEQWPELIDTNPWFDDAEARGIELAQLNISKFVSGNKNAEGEFFFAYKLRRSLESDAGQSLTDEIVAALNLADPYRATNSFEFVVNKLFAFYFRVATKHFLVMEPALPTLVRTARIAMCQGNRLQYNPTPMLFDCMRFLYLVLRNRLAYDPQLLELLISEVYKLAYIWLQQVASSKTEDVYDGAVVGLWTFGTRFTSSGFVWWEIETPEPAMDTEDFDMSAVTNALKGVNRAKVEQDAQNAEEVLTKAWTGYARLAECYERYRRDGIDEGATKYATDAFTEEYTQRPSATLENAV